MDLVIVSGRSGSGKSTALDVLEDIGYDCIDNLPADLLPQLVQKARDSRQADPPRLAVGIDARNLTGNLDDVPELIGSLRYDIRVSVLYLDADDDILLQRFHATRRRHPLTRHGLSLTAAIGAERKHLNAIANCADHVIDTTTLSLYELRDCVKYLVAGTETQQPELIFQSFGFKYGIPRDSDYVFDVRCLPNPYWAPELRSQTGKDPGVISFLESHPDTLDMVRSIQHMLERWLPAFETNNRAYLTISIGCTGGQHRSVYVCEKLAEIFRATYATVKIRHREQRDE
ncbi:MAG: RNase adapter RapZ [Gammaproteobacteria bacterium]|nr:MAG: RNase adapter RapZ [Gammaproteobacteria bacterium]